MEPLQPIKVCTVLVVVLATALLFEGYRFLSDRADALRAEEGLYSDQIVWIPKREPFSMAKGYRLLHEGAVQEALPHFAFALKKDPENVTLLMETAHLFYQTGKDEAAFRLLLKAYKLGDACIKHKALNEMMVVMPTFFEASLDPHAAITTYLKK